MQRRVRMLRQGQGQATMMLPRAAAFAHFCDEEVHNEAVHVLLPQLNGRQLARPFVLADGPL